MSPLSSQLSCQTEVRRICNSEGEGRGHLTGVDLSLCSVPGTKGQFFGDEKMLKMKIYKRIMNTFMNEQINR